MVKNITAFSSNGVKDWLIQRVSAVMLACFIIFLLCVFFTHPQLDYDTWKGIFSFSVVKIFTIISLLALLAHSWIGIWTVLTDYVKSTFVRLVLQWLVILSLMVYLVWGIKIVGSV